MWTPALPSCLYPCAGNKQLVYLKSREKKLLKKPRKKNTKKPQKTEKEEFKINIVKENTTLINQLMLLCYAFVCATWLENCTKKLLYFHSFAIA